VLTFIEKYCTLPLWNRYRVNNFMLAQVVCGLLALCLGVYYAFFDGDSGTLFGGMYLFILWGWAALKTIPKLARDAHAAIAKGLPNPFKTNKFMIGARVALFHGTLVISLFYLGGPGISTVFMLQVLASTFFVLLLGCDHPRVPEITELEEKTN